jgi:hypothetical protein
VTVESSVVLMFVDPFFSGFSWKPRSMTGC